MTSEPPRLPAPQGNAIRQTILRVKLIWRLMRDKRVPLWTKLIPIGGVAYLLFPLDLIFDVVPVLGQVDDIGIILGSFWLFTELCPQDVVHEHWNDLTSVPAGTWREIHDDRQIEAPDETGQSSKK